MSSLYEYVPHPHIAHRNAHGPIKVADQHPRGNVFARFNTWLAIWVTKVVGSMWCAYAFAALDLISLPDAIRGGTSTLIAWIAQTFLQLVLLSIIMVGQNVQAEAADKRSEATFKDTEALLYGQEKVGEHLKAQDEMLRKIAVVLKIEPEPDGEA
ncbi:MAG TPA: hypothetical protein VGZ32_05205 [Actinocrinis sp.]|jgi:hypothetical protein|uniref:hypothetical protein n=1 Tax=Actinocrinis sp. TaxID=1920516 RepID=UPI002DDD1684|nr:hypothetical protein [Actinocrinis sp.]HEV3169710.1 hypothetical protein [Actinocrinis sp.]